MIIIGLFKKVKEHQTYTLGPVIIDIKFFRIGC